MDNVTELLDLHKLVDLDGFGFADSVDIVASEVDEHDVFRSIFWRREKLSSQDGVLCEVEKNGSQLTAFGSDAGVKDSQNSPSGVFPLLTVPAIAWLKTFLFSTLHSVSGLAPTNCRSPKSM